MDLVGVDRVLSGIFSLNVVGYNIMLNNVAAKHTLKSVRSCLLVKRNTTQHNTHKRMALPRAMTVDAIVVYPVW
jgi:hypothetical protein